MANAATWSSRVREWRNSGKTAPQFCKGRDFAVGTLRWWACRLEREQREWAEPPSSFRVVRVVPRPSATEASAPEATPRRAGLVVEVGDARVSVYEGFDAEALAAVLDVLEARVSGAGR